MRYVERVLQPDETIVYVTRLHWLVYARAVVLLIIALIFLLAAAKVEVPLLVLALKTVSAAFAVLAITSALRGLIRRTTTELAVTDRRVIFKTGMLRRHTLEMNRSKVETVGVDQSVSGRVLGYGTIIVRGTGGSFEPIPFIGDPLTFRSHITAG